MSTVSARSNQAGVSPKRSQANTKAKRASRRMQAIEGYSRNGRAAKAVKLTLVKDNPAPVDQLSDREWNRMGAKLEKIAARQGARRAINYFLSNRHSSFESDVDDTLKGLMECTAAKMAKGYRCAPKTVLSLTCRARRAVLARHETWFRGHVAGLTDAQIARWWKCKPTVVAAARRSFILRFPEATSDFEEAAMAAEAECVAAREAEKAPVAAGAR